MNILQSSTAYPIVFLLVSSTDHITGVTGLTPTVKLSKNGGTGVSPSGAVSEIDSTNLPGLYKVAGNATDSGTLGPIWVHASGTGVDPYDAYVGDVVAYNEQDGQRLGLAALPSSGTLAVKPAVTLAASDVTGNVPTDLQTIKTQTVAAASGVTFPSSIGNSTFASGGSVNAAQIGGQTASASGTITFPAATLASTTNITAGTIATVSGNVNGNVAGNVIGNVGSISGVTFPSNFAGLNIDGAGFVTLATSQNFSNVTAVLLPTIPVDWISASGLKADAVAKIQNGLPTPDDITDAIGAVFGAGPYTQLTGAQIRTDVGMASANLDFQLSAILTAAESGGGGGLSGPSSVTLTFVDALSAPVANVEFTVLTQGTDRANPSGVAAFGLNDGMYTVTAGPVNGVMFPNTTLTVLGTTALTITGSSNSITPPSNPTLCRVYGYAVTIQGTIASKVAVGFALNASSASKTSTGVAPGNLLAQFNVNVTSDSTGFFFADLVSNQPYIINASSLKFNGFAFQTTGGGTTLDLSTLVVT